MKTNFALGLTQDGITLWQRDGSGWLRVGAVALDNPDMDTAMAALVGTARKLSPDGLATKLVIPEEHMLVTSLHAPGPGREAQEIQIRAALAGRTPFPVEDLVFDWSGAGTTVAVTVVARETLIEAEDFAVAQGLNPVAFVAATAPDGFRGEPFFGLTRAMRAKRVNPADVLRDGMVVRETGIARVPDTPPVVEPVIPDVAPVVAEPVDAAPILADPDAASKQVQAPVVSPDVAVTPTPAPNDTAGAAAAPIPSVALSKALAPDAAQAPVVQPAMPKADAAAAAPPIDPAPVLPAPVLPAPVLPAPVLPAPVRPGAFMSSVATPDTGPAIPRTEGDFGFRTRRQAQGTAPAPTANGQTSENARSTAWKPDASKSTSDKASGDQTGVPALSKLGQTLRARYQQTNSSVASKVSALRAAVAQRKNAVAASTAPAKSKSPAPTTAQPATAQAETPRPSLLATLAARQSKPAPAAPGRSTPLETLRKVQATTSRQTAPPAATSTAKADEAQRMTVFGARGTATDIAPSPLPRKALLITGGALLVLVSAAIWALYFSAAEPEQAQAPSSTTTAPDVAAPAPLALPPLEEQDPADLAAIEAALGQADAAQAERLAEDGSDAATATVPPEAADAQADAAPVPAGETSADTVQAPPRDTDAGRVAEIRSNGIVAPQDQSGVIAAPSPPAPFGADPLPPLRGSPEALALQSAAPESAAPESATPETAPVADITPAQPEVVATPAPPVTLAPPATPVLPAGEDALTIGVTEGVPPSVPPAKPARLTQPETPAPETLAPETLAPEAPAAPPGQGASVPPPPVTEADLVIQVTQGTPAVVPPRRAESNVAPATVPAAAPVPVAPVPVEPAPGQQGSLLPITPAEGVVSPDTPPASTDLAAATVAPPPPGGVALSALRPAARPSDLRRVAEPVVPEEPAFPNATEEAVETSVRPNGRPAQFAEVVQRALRVATQRQATPPPATEATEAVQTASAAVAMPALPTSTSVAREATVARAINLRQVNLLGVMGTSSNRRALVRLSNGRIVTVRVGENLDDGQVTAIGDTELRYVRRGRDVVLRIAS